MKSSKSSLFLMELIVAILFFSIASAICVQMFVHANKTDQNTQITSHYSIICQNLAESFYASGEDFMMIEELYGNQNMISILSDVDLSCHTDDPKVVLLFTNDFKPIEATAFSENSADEETAFYQAELSIDDSDYKPDGAYLLKASIVFSEYDGQVLYTLDLQKYIQYKGAVNDNESF